MYVFAVDGNARVEDGRPAAAACFRWWGASSLVGDFGKVGGDARSQCAWCVFLCATVESPICLFGLRFYAAMFWARFVFTSKRIFYADDYPCNQSHQKNKREPAVRHPCEGTAPARRRAIEILQPVLATEIIWVLR